MYFLKILIIGDNNTGKTSLIQKITTNKFNYKNQIPTLGLNFFKIIKKHNNDKFQIDFWDFSGSKEYLPLLENYYQESDIILICFDVSEKSTFQSIQSYWLPILHDFEKIKEKKIILIGNKNDLQKDINVPQKDIFYFSAKNDNDFSIFLENIIEIYCIKYNIKFTKENKKINALSYFNKLKIFFKKKS